MNHEPRRRIVFTKPKPFVGKKANGSTASKTPARSGRKLVRSSTQRDKAASERRHAEAGDGEVGEIYDFSSSDEAESIEDC